MLALLACLLLFAAGCVDFEQQILINPDGSGEVEYKFVVAEGQLPLLKTARQVLDEWQGAEAPANRQTAAAAADPFSREAVRRAFEAPGVRLDEYASHAWQGRHIIRFSLKADDIAASLNAGRFGDLSLKPAGGGRLRFAADFIETDGDGKLTAAQRQELAAVCRGMRLKLAVRGPGRLLETTGKRAAAQNAEWLFEADRNPDFLVRPPKVEAFFAVDKFPTK